jgi:hypothetical protein
MNDNTNSYLNNLYKHLNNNQCYVKYKTSVELEQTHSSTINQSVYEKLLHDFQNYRR